MFNAVFVVWRECFEAILIVGILYSYLKRQEGFKRSSQFLTVGVLAGILLSILLAYGIQHAETELQGATLEYFETSMLAFAALLMTHMCIWMKQHARTIRAELEQGLAAALSNARLVGISLLAMIAVAREGAEVVIFFYGMGIESKAGGGKEIVLAALIGAGLTAVTAVAFYRGVKAFNPKWFFRITTGFLFLTASTLLLTAARKLLQSGVLPTVRDQIWDTSFILDERSVVGQLVAAMTGYESSPSLILVLIGCLYWVVSLSLYFSTCALLRRFIARSGLAVFTGSCAGGFLSFAPDSEACPIVLALSQSMQAPTSLSDKAVRDLSLYMLRGLTNERGGPVMDHGPAWSVDCAAASKTLQDALGGSLGSDGRLDWRKLQTEFESHFLETRNQRQQDVVIKSRVEELQSATGFDAWESRIVAFSAVKRKSRRIFRSPEGVLPRVSISQTLDSEEGDPTAPVLETEIAVKRHLGADWDFYSYNGSGELASYSTFPFGEAPSPRICMNCHYSSSRRAINRFLPGGIE